MLKIKELFSTVPDYMTGLFDGAEYPWELLPTLRGFIDGLVLMTCGEDFSLYNLFFDFLDDRPIRENNRSACIFMKHFDVNLCLPRIEFEDATVLNHSRIIRNLSCEKLLRQLLYKDPKDALYRFFGLSALFSVLTNILESEQNGKKKNRPVEPILEYIKTNPEKDLSADALSSPFTLLS